MNARPIIAMTGSRSASAASRPSPASTFRSPRARSWWSSALGLGQIHADPLHQPVGGARRRHHRRGTAMTVARGGPIWPRCAPRSAMVFQSFNLFPHMTVLRNVALGPVRVRGIGWPEAEARARRLLLERVGLPPRSRRQAPGQLSAANSAGRHRAGAGAGAEGAAVRRADFRARSGDGRRGAGGDPDASPARGVTMVVVTHEMGFARRVADRVVCSWTPVGSWRRTRRRPSSTPRAIRASRRSSTRSCRTEPAECRAFAPNPSMPPPSHLRRGARLRRGCRPPRQRRPGAQGRHRRAAEAIAGRPVIAIYRAAGQSLPLLLPTFEHHPHATSASCP